MGFGCDNLESINYSNFNDDICYVTALGRNPTSGVIKMYRIPTVSPDAGTFPIGQMFSGEREKQDGFNTFGKVNSSSLGNEVVSELSTSLTLRADTIYDALNPSVLPSTVNRNTMMAMLEGSGIDDDGTYVELISMSGARLTCPLVETDAKYLFYKDGYFVIDGKKKDSTTGEPRVRSNPYIDKYNKTNICTLMELGISPTAETTDDVVFRFPFVASSNVQFAEGTDANNYTADCMFLADRRHTAQFIYDGFSANEVDTVAAAGTTSIYKINADYIISVAGGGLPTISGLDGEVAIVINSDGTLSGTVAVTTGTVTGTSTKFEEELGVGSTFIISGVSYTVSSIASNTSMVLTDATFTVGAGATASTTVGTTLIWKLDANGTAWESSPVTSTLGKGFVAHTSEYHTALDGTGGVSGEVNFATIQTAGISGVAISGQYGTAFVIQAKHAITDVVDRATFWENYTV